MAIGVASRLLLSSKLSMNGSCSSMLMSAFQSRWQKKSALSLLKAIRKHIGFNAKINSIITTLHMVSCVLITSIDFFRQKVPMSKAMSIPRS